MILNSPYISGSLTVTGNTNLIGALTVTGSLAGTATSSSFAFTASSAVSAYTAASAVNATTALTASYATSFTVGGTLTAQTLVVQTITSSVSFITGSTRFGSLLTNTHEFTGSLRMTGSAINVNNNKILIGDDGTFSGNYSTVGFGGTTTGFNRIFASTTTADGLYLLAATGRGVYIRPGGKSTQDLSVFPNGNTALGVNFLLPTATLHISGSGSGSLMQISSTVSSSIFFVSGSGNIGIGTTSPSTLLDLRLATADGVAGSVSSSYAIASFVVNASGGGQRGLQVGGPTGGISSPVFLKVFGTGQRFAILNETNIENFTVTNEGNVGIGTSSPIGPLTVAVSASGASIAATTSQQAYDYSRFRIKHYTDSNLGLSIGYAGANYSYIQACYNEGTTAPLLINPFGGNISVGTATPDGVLTVQKDTDGDTPIYFTNASGGSGNTNASVTLDFRLRNGSGGSTGGVRLKVGKETDHIGTNVNDYFAISTTRSDSMGERFRITSAGDILLSGGNTTGQSSVSTCTALRFPNQYSSGYTDAGVKLFIFNSGGTIQGFTAGPAYDLQYHSSGDNTNGKHAWYVGNVQVMRVQSTSGNVTILGSLSKGSGSFRIKHPLASKKNTHQLVHSFIEGPQADLIYSGRVTLVDGRAVINIDEVATMTEGTFEALCRNIRVFTSNETSWDNVRGKVEGNILTIECQNTESTDEVSWLVIGERQDEHMFDTEWTDENGKVIVEPLIPADPGNLMQGNN